MKLDAEKGREYKQKAEELQFKVKCGEAEGGEALRQEVQRAYAAAAGCFRSALKHTGRDEAIQLMLELAEVYAALSAGGAEARGYEQALYYACLSYSLAKQRRQEEGGRTHRMFYENLICTLCEKSGISMDAPELTRWKNHYQK